MTVRIGDIAVHAACTPTTEGDIIWLGCSADLSNLSSGPVDVAAVEIGANDGVVRAWTLDPGQTAHLPQPSSGMWAVIARSEADVRRAAVWRTLGAVLLWGLAGWGAGSIVVNIMERRACSRSSPG